MTLKPISRQSPFYYVQWQDTRYFLIPLKYFDKISYPELNQKPLIKLSPTCDEWLRP